MKSIELGALWEKTDRNGNKYYSGSMNIFPHGQVNVTIFKNTYKQNDNHPDLKVYYNPIGQEDNKGVTRNDSGDITF